MDPQSFLDILVGIVVMLIAAIVKVLWDAVKSLQKDLTRIEVALPTVYVPKHEFQSEMREIKNMLEKIDSKLDGKADKTR